MKRLTSLILCLCLCIPLFSCEKRQKKYSETYFDFFDSFAQITAYEKKQSEWQEHLNIFKGAVEKYHRILDIYNSYDGIVNLYDVNNAEGEPVGVSRELFDFLTYAKDAYILTDGYTNVCMGTVTSLWKSAIEEKTVPDSQELKEAAGYTDISAIVMYEDDLTVSMTDPNLRIDAGAIGKGYAAEMIRRELAAAGCESFMINLGGTLCAYGAKPDGEVWLGGVQSPNGTQQQDVSIKLSGKALSTSGSYHRGYTADDGTLYHHIIDPHTLAPKNTFLSVSVACENAADADALSTALFNMTLEDGRRLVESLENTEALWILCDGSSVQTQNFSN